MKVYVLLADKGTLNPQAGTLNLLNAGWSQTPLLQNPIIPGGAGTPPMAVAVFFEVDHSDCNHPIELVLELRTEDGHPVVMPGTPDQQPMRISQYITVPSPGGAPMGTPGVGNALFEFQPGLSLTLGGYRWEVTLAGKHEDAWVTSFRVISAPSPTQVTFGRTEAS